MKLTEKSLTTPLVSGDEPEALLVAAPAASAPAAEALPVAAPAASDPAPGTTGACDGARSPTQRLAPAPHATEAKWQYLGYQGRSVFGKEALQDPQWKDFRPEDTRVLEEFHQQAADAIDGKTFPHGAGPQLTIKGAEYEVYDFAGNNAEQWKTQHRACFMQKQRANERRKRPVRRLRPEDVPAPPSIPSITRPVDGPEAFSRTVDAGAFLSTNSVGSAIAREGSSRYSTASSASESSAPGGLPTVPPAAACPEDVSGVPAAILAAAPTAALAVADAVADAAVLPPAGSIHHCAPPQAGGEVAPKQHSMWSPKLPHQARLRVSVPMNSLDSRYSVPEDGGVQEDTRNCCQKCRQSCHSRCQQCYKWCCSSCIAP